MSASLDGLEVRRGPLGEAVFSTSAQYRYNLVRRWDQTPSLLDDPDAPKRFVLWVMLNPSTADENVLDNTLTRCKDFSHAWGYDGMIVRNVFAYRTPYPKVMMDALAAGVDVVGPRNDEWLADRTDVGLTVVGWGALKHARARGERVLELLGDGVVCMGRNLDGSPRHPLYLADTTEPEPFELAEVA